MNKDLLIDDILKEKASSETLSLPGDLNIMIKQTLADLPERKKHKRKIAKSAITAAVISLVAVTSLGIAFPAYARNMPVVSSVFEFLSEKNLIDREYIEYSSDLNLSKTYDDVTVTINSIVYDGIDLSIAYTVESKEEMEGMPHIMDKEFKINGRKTSFGSGGTGKLINKNTYVGVNSFDVSRDYLPKEVRKETFGGNVDVPDNFIMDLNIREFSNGISGKWDFKFKVSIDKIKGKVEQVKTAIDLSKIGGNLKVNEVIFTPINTVLRTTEDNTNSDDMIEYIVFDDKGRKLSQKGASGHGSGVTNKAYWQYTFSNIYEDTKSVTIIPTTRTNEYKTKVKNANGSFELDKKEATLNLNGTTLLSQGKFGEYKVNKLELFEDKTLVYYECTNLLPAISPYGLIIKDESGKIYSMKIEAIKDQGDNNFVADIEPLAKGKKYTLMANDLEKMYDIREDLKFTIDVK
jgi:hypothetical protein